MLAATSCAYGEDQKERLRGTQTEVGAEPVPPSVSTVADFSTGVLSPVPAEAVATFESIGLYWKLGNTPGARDCLVRYRKAGAPDWREGLPLWFDARNGECRGSLVMLSPDAEFEIELLEPTTKALARVQTRTWRETFPIAQTVYLPEESDVTLTIDRSGAPDGYLLFTARPGSTASIDVGGRADNNIVVNGSYIIIRGLTIQNAGRNAIMLGKDAHDVVIEENDISGWGRVDVDGWGQNMDAAIANDYADASPIARLVIQRNTIHHPRADSNAWDEYRPEKNTKHPVGPQAISLWNTAGNHVIRYNEVYSDDDHKFNDCLGGGSNFSDRGFPSRDSDIYGNKLGQCWDDAIESEGGNTNVRIWGNYIDQTFVMIAVAATQTGPIYIWRNIADRSRLSATRDMAKAKRGVFLKSQSKAVGRRDENGERQYFGDGRIYVFHNTLVQRPGENEGVYAGLSDLSGKLANITSRNNILQVNSDGRPCIADSEREPSNDFDFDLCNGKLNVRDGQEEHGVAGEPIYDQTEGHAAYALDPASPGHDAGVILPNYNDGFIGAAPDMGAQEAGAPPLQFGVGAYR